MTTPLGDAISRQQQALSGLRAGRSETAAWRDEQRDSLDRSRLDPLESDGQRLLEALQRTDAELARAEQLLR